MYEWYEDNTQEQPFRWRYRDKDNGEIIAVSSEAYARKEDMMKGIMRMKRSAQDDIVQVDK